MIRPGHTGDRDGVWLPTLVLQHDLALDGVSDAEGRDGVDWSVSLMAQRCLSSSCFSRPQSPGEDRGLLLFHIMG
jgi:hypothetical protein